MFINSWYFSISNSPLTERLALFALQNAEQIIARAREVTGKNLELLDSFFEQNSDHVPWVRPEGGTTAFPWLTSSNDARPFCQALLKQGILLAPGDCFGMPEHFRLGFGAASSDIRPALQTITNYFRSSEMGSIPPAEVSGEIRRV